MALCRRCRVREASDLPWKKGLCPECYGDQERNNKPFASRVNRARYGSGNNYKHREKLGNNTKYSRADKEAYLA